MVRITSRAGRDSVRGRQSRCKEAVQLGRASCMHQADWATWGGDGEEWNQVEHWQQRRLCSGLCLSLGEAGQGYSRTQYGGFNPCAGRWRGSEAVMVRNRVGSTVGHPCPYTSQGR